MPDLAVVLVTKIKLYADTCLEPALSSAVEAVEIHSGYGDIELMIPGAGAETTLVSATKKVREIHTALAGGTLT